jgi:hypothetical protein
MTSGQTTSAVGFILALGAFLLLPRINAARK